MIDSSTIWAKKQVVRSLTAAGLLRFDSRAGLVQELAELRSLLLGQMSDKVVAQVEDRFLHRFHQCATVPGQFDVPHAAVLVAADPCDEISLFEFVEQAGDGRHDGHHLSGHFQAPHGAVFAVEDPEDVVLRLGQTMFAKQASELVLELIVGFEDRHDQFFGTKAGRLLRVGLFLAFFGSHVGCSHFIGVSAGQE